MNRRTFLKKALIASLVPFLPNELKLHAKQKEVVKVTDGYWKAQILRADVPNSNRRVYPRLVVEKAYQNYKTCGLRGQLGMPQNVDFPISVDNISHVVEKLSLKDDYLIAEIQVLNTPKGKILNDLFENNPESIAFRTAGTGNVKAREDDCFVISDFILTGIHAVLASNAATL